MYSISFNLIFAFLPLLHFASFVSTGGNDRLGFDPVATLLQHCIVDSSTITPNFLEENSVTKIDTVLVVNKIN